MAARRSPRQTEREATKDCQLLQTFVQAVQFPGLLFSGVHLQGSLSSRTAKTIYISLVEAVIGTIYFGWMGRMINLID